MRLRGFALGLAALAMAGASIAAELPRIERVGSKHMMIVDGRPYLMLAAQAHNSSNYPSQLPLVWPVIKQLHANTLEIPVAWEQIEPAEGRFDFSYLDTLLAQARQNDVHLVLLWFGTWKNTGPSYAPEWVKTNTARFPRMKKADGTSHYVLTPHSRSNLEADKKAFVRLLQYLRDHDQQNTVIMIQPENEMGSYNLTRDHSAEANRLFNGPVPAELVRGLNKRPGTWTQVFGEFAEQAFTSWAMGRYTDEIAAAGKAVKKLPMYVNSSLANPFDAKAAIGTATGGPQWNMIPVWKIAAPNIDVLAPDIYSHDAKSVIGWLDHYNRPDNALMVPEIGNDSSFARFLWPVLGRGGIGFSPFGMDATGYSNYPLGAKVLDAETIEAFASKYRILRPIQSSWARLAASHPTWGAAKGGEPTAQSTIMGRWKVGAEFEQWEFGEQAWLPKDMDPPPAKGKPTGGLAVIQLGADEFLVVGSDVRARFDLADPAPGENSAMLRVEEGTFDDQGRWSMSRVWNGDQTDYGLNITSQPRLLKVKMGTYR
jgi:beta-galactosidase GanA